MSDLPVSAAAVFVVTAVLLTACGGSAPDPRAEGKEDAPVAVSSLDPVAATPPGGPTPVRGPAATRPLPVDASLSDPVMGHRFEVAQVVHGFAAPARLSALTGRQFVLVEVTAVAGEKYYSSLDGTELTIVEPGSAAPSSATSVISAEMTAAGYPPLARVRAGGSGTGWLAFLLSKTDSRGLLLRYTRLPYIDTSTDQPIPRATFDVRLPDPAAST